MKVGSIGETVTIDPRLPLSTLRMRRTHRSCRARTWTPFRALETCSPWVPMCPVST
jgi:hypothetical protein